MLNALDTTASHDAATVPVAAPSTRPFRLLFAVDTPWTETLGVPRVSIEIGRLLTRAGHRVDKFSIEDVAPAMRGRLRGMFALSTFQRALFAHVRQRGTQYDVIQAEHNTLVFNRPAYRFDGLMIAKSNGLRHFYEDYCNGVERELRRHSGDTGTFVGNALRAVASRRAFGMSGAADRSFRTADQIHLLNADELTFVRDTLGQGDKCVLVGNGLSDNHAAALADAAMPDRRVASRSIAFVGTWCLRKGTRELPAIFRAVRGRCPEAKLRLLGVLASAAEVRSAFADVDRGHVEVIERFDPDQLPALLADVRVGLFPSYVEGFPLGALEMLAAALPVVAWDVPGPRQLLAGPLADGLVQPGDALKTAERLLVHLNLDNVEYRARSSMALAASLPHRWEQVAATFLAAVRAGLARKQAHRFPV